MPYYPKSSEELIQNIVIIGYFPVIKTRVIKGAIEYTVESPGLATSPPIKPKYTIDFSLNGCLSAHLKRIRKQLNL